MDPPRAERERERARKRTSQAKLNQVKSRACEKCIKSTSHLSQKQRGKEQESRLKEIISHPDHSPPIIKDNIILHLLPSKLRFREQRNTTSRRMFIIAELIERGVRLNSAEGAAG